MIRLLLAVWLALGCAALAEPAAPPTSATTTPTASATPVSLNELVDSATEEGEEEELPPSAKDENRPAIFNVMIAGRLEQRAGTHMKRISREALVPWIFSLILLPVYLKIASRRGFAIPKEKKP